MNIGLLMLILFVALFLAVPIGSSFTGVTVLASLFNHDVPLSLDTILRSMFNQLNSFPLLAVPLFMFAGVVMARGGISKKLFDFFAYFIGNLTAGFPCAVVLTCLMYGAISGSGPATAAAVGSMAIPFLTRMGYDLKFCSALVAISGGLGVIIPPSIPFVIYSSVANTSTGDLFIAGILPGILIGVFLMVWCVIYCKRYGEDKAVLKKNYEEIRAKGFWTVFKESFWAFLAPIIILGSIYGGIASPTEAAGISIFYAFIISMWVYKSMTWKDLIGMIREGVASFAAIVFIIGAAAAFGKMLTLMQIPTMVQQGMLDLTTTVFGVLLIVNIVLIIAGMLVDATVAILILAPVFLPLITALNIDLIYFGVIMVVNLAVGFVTPPMGMNLFVTSNLTGVPTIEIAKKAVPFMVAFMTALVIIDVFPSISLALLNLR